MKKTIYLILIFLGLLYGIITLNSWYSISIIPNDQASRIVISKQLTKVFTNALPPLTYYFWNIINKFITLTRINIFYTQILLYISFSFSIYFLYKKIFIEDLTVILLTIITISSSLILQIFLFPNYYSLEIIIFTWVFFFYFYKFDKTNKYIYLFISIILVIVIGYIHYPAIIFLSIIFIDLVIKQKLYLLKKYKYFLLISFILLFAPLTLMMYKYSKIISKAKDWPLINLSWGLKDLFKLPGYFISMSVPDYNFSYIILILFIIGIIYLFNNKNNTSRLIIYYYIIYFFIGLSISRIHNYISVSYILPIVILFYLCIGQIFCSINKILKILLFLIFMYIIVYSNIYHYKKSEFHNKPKLKEYLQVSELLKQKKIDFILHTNIFSFIPYKALGLINNKIILSFNKSAHFHTYCIDENENIDLDKLKKYKNNFFVIINYQPIPNRVLNDINSFINKNTVLIKEIDGVKIYKILPLS